jgi:glycerol-3-phosphate dehydrogenase
MEKRKFCSKFKTKLVIEALKERETLAQLALHSIYIRIKDDTLLWKMNSLRIIT